MKTISQIQNPTHLSPKRRNSCLLVDLRKIRSQLGITLEQVAEQIGTSRQNIQMVEGGSGVRILTALKLARFYEMPVEAIWGIPE